MREGRSRADREEESAASRSGRGSLIPTTLHHMAPAERSARMARILAHPPMLRKGPPNTRAEAPNLRGDTVPRGRPEGVEASKYLEDKVLGLCMLALYPGVAAHPPNQTHMENSCTR